MPEAFKRGFKTYCEQISGETRSELGLTFIDALDSIRLAEYLDIPIMSITELTRFGAKPRDVSVLMQSGRGLSAFTVVRGTYKAIFYNPAHPSTRRANSLAHELSHVLLEHQPAIAVLNGERNWNGACEAEADWLAATMLVPRAGAFRWLSGGGTVANGAQHFQVSEVLFRWRVLQTGVARQLGLTG